MRFLTFLFLSIATSFVCQSQNSEHYRLVFWNVENLFDIWDDSTSLDDDFTPRGQYHWTSARYGEKQKHLAQAIISLGIGKDNKLQPPLIVGLAEVENDKVLRDLCQGTALRRFGYKFIHFDSPDRRGIDNALLYDKERFTPCFTQNICVSDSTKGFFTRDILLVEGVTDKGDTLIILVNHFPSKRNSGNAVHRIEIAQRLRNTLDTLAAMHPAAAIVTMGDFNASPNEPEIKSNLLQDSDCCFVNLMAHKSSKGSYKYKGNWEFLDQIIVSRNLLTPNSRCPLALQSDSGQVFDSDFLLVDDNTYLGKKVKRTFLGPRYIGGYSDHLPVYVDLIRKGPEKE